MERRKRNAIGVAGQRAEVETCRWHVSDAPPGRLYIEERNCNQRGIRKNSKSLSNAAVREFSPIFTSPAQGTVFRQGLVYRVRRGGVLLGRESPSGESPDATTAEIGFRDAQEANTRAVRLCVRRKPLARRTSGCRTKLRSRQGFPILVDRPSTIIIARNLALSSFRGIFFNFFFARPADRLHLVSARVRIGC